MLRQKTFMLQFLWCLAQKKWLFWLAYLPYFQLDWMKFFQHLMSVTNITVKGTEPIVSYAPDYLRKMSDLITDTMQTEQGRR